MKKRWRTRRWTADEHATLKRMFDAGRSDALIAQRLRRSVSSVWHKRLEHRLLRSKVHPYRFWSGAKDVRLKAMFEAGVSDAEMAITLGRTASAIHHRRHELRLLRTIRGRAGSHTGDIAWKQAKIEAAERHREALARWGKL